MPGGAVLQVGRVHAVDDEPVLRTGSAIDLDAARLRLVLRAGRGLQDRLEVAALRHALDGLALNRRERRVLLDVDERRFAGDGDRLGHAGELQRQVDREQLAERHDGVADLGRHEALKVGADLVGSGRQRRKSIDAVGVGHRRADTDGRRTAGLNGHAGEHSPGRVLDDALNRTGLFLCYCRQRQQRYRRTGPHMCVVNALLIHPPENDEQRVGDRRLVSSPRPLGRKRPKWSSRPSKSTFRTLLCLRNISLDPVV